MLFPLAWLTGAGIGAGAMYCFDPERGQRRRAVLRDQLAHAGARAAKAADVVRRDAKNRLVGTLAECRGALRRDRPSNRVLEDRVRSHMGRVVSHPAAIEVHADEGRISLFGSVLADEAEALLATVRRVRGVADVENRLQVHPEASNIAGLQGGRRRVSRPLDLIQESWSPTTRALVGATGVMLMGASLSRGAPAASLLGGLGFWLTATAAINRSHGQAMKKGVGRNGGRQSDFGQSPSNPKSESLDRDAGDGLSELASNRGLPALRSERSEYA
jgi:hypothetical protein